jgi:phosphoribosylformylglycinamidine synthase
VAGGLGCTVALPGDPFTALFSESAARAVAEVAPGAGAAFSALCEQHGVPLTELGTVGGADLAVTGWFSVPVAELAAVRERVLPALFG